MESAENIGLTTTMDKTKSMSITNSLLVLICTNTNLEHIKYFKQLRNWIDCNGETITSTELGSQLEPSTDLGHALRIQRNHLHGTPYDGQSRQSIQKHLRENLQPRAMDGLDLIKTGIRRRSPFGAALGQVERLR